MTILRNNASNLFETYFYMAAFDEFNRYPDEYPEVFNVKTSTKRKEYYTRFGGFPMAPEKNEDEAMAYYDPVEMYDQTFTHKTIAYGAKISWEADADEQYGVFKRLFGTMGRGIKQKMEQDAADFLVDAFTDSGPDGVALFDYNHPRNPEDATTWANTPYTGTTIAHVDLSVASLKAARLNFMRQKDERGLVIRAVPKTLIFAPELEPIV